MRFPYVHPREHERPPRINRLEDFGEVTILGRPFNGRSHILSVSLRYVKGGPEDFPESHFVVIAGSETFRENALVLRTLSFAGIIGVILQLLLGMSYSSLEVF